MYLNASKSVNWNESTSPAGVTTDTIFIGPGPFPFWWTPGDER